jgi:Zn finger protein HypA/HybF involved in hydrogenase expression
MQKKDWREKLNLSEEDEEFLEELLETKVCNYCRHQVSPDIGQVEIYCPHCEMVTQAVKQ